MSIQRVDEIDDLVKIDNVLISLFNKEGIEEFVHGLLDINSDTLFYSTGGTGKKIIKILGSRPDTNPVSHFVSVESYTGYPEMPGGLVKTLHPMIHGAILGETYNPAQREHMREEGMEMFDMVIVNLYDFAKASAQGDPEDARGHIDIGGPCMIRAAAKNFLRVAAVVDPADYKKILGTMEDNAGCLSLYTRIQLAVKAFELTANYDRAINEYFGSKFIDQISTCYKTIHKTGGRQNA